MLFFYICFYQHRNKSCWGRYTLSKEMGEVFKTSQYWEKSMSGLFLLDTLLLKIRQCFSTYMKLTKWDVNFTYIRCLHCAVRMMGHCLDVKAIMLIKEIPGYQDCFHYMCNILGLAFFSFFSEGKSLIIKAGHFRSTQKNNPNSELTLPKQVVVKFRYLSSKLLLPAAPQSSPATTWRHIKFLLHQVVEISMNHKVRPLTEWHQFS